MAERALTIFDETLRDGEQQAGLCFPPGAKLELAQRIARAGAHQIDVMPVVDASEAELAATLVESGLGGRLTPATLLGKDHIDQAKTCGVERIILFYAVSDRLMFLRDPEVRSDSRFDGRSIEAGLPSDLLERIRERTLARVIESLAYATSPGIDLRVQFAAEDASRADAAFLLRCIEATRPYVDHFLLCDTVGVLRPERSGDWIRELLGASEGASLGVHFHNDLGHALENTIQAVLAGASLISGTFGGIGERAGNVALDRVLHGLRDEHGIEIPGIDYAAIDSVTAHLDALGLHPAEPFSVEAQRHESGIHVQSLLRDRKSYCIFDDREPEIWFGKMSGASNFEYLFERILARPQEKAVYESLAAALKRRSIEQARCFSSGEVVELIEKGSLLAEGC